MPEVGEGVSKAEIVELKVKLGGPIKEYDDLFIISTDKATQEVSSP